MEKIMEERYLKFARIWGMFNAVRKAGYSDSGWEACVNEADSIGGDGDLFIQDVICCIVSEAERQSRMDDLRQRKMAYLISGKAFSLGWQLYKTLMECEPGNEFSEKGIYLLRDYLEQYEDKTFPTKLGNVIYKEVCRVKNEKGGLIPDLLTFYNKYARGITEDNRVAAYEDAELLMNSRPEYTLHIMSMINDLQKRSASSMAA